MKSYLGIHRSIRLFVTLSLSVLLFIGVAPITSAISSSRRVPATCFVSPSGDDNNDGKKATPYRTIQAAMNNAATGDTVTLLDGTYSGNGNRDLDFGGKSITVSSANGAEKTIIDCGGDAPKNDVLPHIPAVNHRAFHCHRKETRAIISGLTIKKGYVAENNGGGGAIKVDEGSTVVVKNIVFQENKSGSLGGACANDGTLTAEKCAFRQNVSFYSLGGGGIYNQGTVNLTDCDFEKNEVVYAVRADGGGLVNANSAILSKCRFKGNQALSGGGLTNGGTLRATDCTFIGNNALGGGGGGIDSSGDAVLTRCIVSGNRSVSGGGGIHNDSGGSFVLTKCIVSGNISEEDTPKAVGSRASLSSWEDGGGGGLWIRFAKATLTDCVIQNNKCDHGNGGGITIRAEATLTNCVITGNMTLAGSGGGISIYNPYGSNAPLLLKQCTFSGNVAKGDNTQGGAIYNDSANIALTNCIFWGNTAPNANQIGLGTSNDPVVNATYCDIQGGLSGTGNIKADPLFVDAGKGDFHLKNGSPCIGAGSSAAPVSPKTTNPPADPSQSPTKTTTVKTDIEGKVRPPKPSMGAYEGAAKQ